MIIHDTVACQPACRDRGAGRRIQTILALCDCAPACRACLPRLGGRQARGVGRCLFLQSIYLQSIYLMCPFLLTHKAGIPYVPSQ